jgi:anti-sigma factor RsiW
MSVDLHTLTGAYALHATSDTERVAFERHLTDCPSCGQEVRELRETAARLGLTTAAIPPPHLRHAVLTRIHRERQTRALRRRGPALATRLVGAAAAVLLAVTVSLGAMLMARHHDLDQARHRTDMLTAVVQAQDARFAHADGFTVVVSRSQDRGVLIADLPPAPDGHTYQAWTVDTAYHSAGTLTDGMTELTGIATADHVAITVEPEGGSTQPTTKAITETAIP